MSGVVQLGAKPPVECAGGRIETRLGDHPVQFLPPTNSIQGF
jgi:hypothetical protein